MRIIILIVLVISGLTAVACSSEAPSTADEQTASRPTADVPATVEAGISGTREAETAVDATVEAKVAATLTTSTPILTPAATPRATNTPLPTSTPGPTNTPAATTLSLDEYLTLCATTDIDPADDATYGDLSFELSAEADRFEALTPPAQLSEWHLLNIEAYRTAQAVIDTQPTDDVMDFDNPTMNAAGDDFEEKLREAAARVPEDVLQRMIDAGCIDSYLVPDDYTGLPDDHGNSEGDATAIRVGADVRGTLDYDDDIDFFRFQAEQGQSYQIDVALGTLDDSILNLYDTEGWFLDTNDDYGNTYASRLSWYAGNSGERYVAVEGYGTGTYTLTVSLIIDDHGDSEGDATAIGVGAEVGGELEYDGDFDYFSFQAEAGWSYQIDVALGTLDDSIVELYDADGSFLDANDNYGNTYASRLSWYATSSGEKYVFVGGYGIGTYTLTVSLIDDHGNDFESATRIAIGEAVAVELEHLDDIDVLVFRARPGTEFLLTLNWEYYAFRENYTEPPLLAVYSANGQEQTRLMGYDFREIEVPSIGLVWRALTGGDYYIVIGDGNTEGASAFSVTEEEATEPIATPTAAPRATSTPRPTPPTSSFDSVSAGAIHTCGVMSNGSVACWGADEYGEATPPAGSFVSFSAGGAHTCGVRNNGSVACWGWDEYGQATPPAGSFDSVSVGYGHTCGLRSDGSVACWGGNWDGQATPPAGSFVSVSAGYDHTCGVRSDGSVACWGENDDGQATPPAGSFVSVSAGSEHTCGVSSNGSVACWGRNESGRATPPAGSFDSVSAGGSHTCGVRSNGSVACWGSDYWFGDYSGQATPPAGSFVSVSAGWVHTCGVRSNGSVACWGSDEYGQATPPGSSLVSVSAGGGLIDDHGNDFENANRLAIGEGVGFELQYHGQKFVIVLRARAGAEYVFTLNWESYSLSHDPGDPGSMMALYDASGRVLARLNDYDFSERRVRNEIAWRAVTGGDHYIVVGNEYVDGTFAFSVTER